jgi:hypothetical protein
MAVELPQSRIIHRRGRDGRRQHACLPEQIEKPRKATSVVGAISACVSRAGGAVHASDPAADHLIGDLGQLDFLLLEPPAERIGVVELPPDASARIVS